MTSTVIGKLQAARALIDEALSDLQPPAPAPAPPPLADITPGWVRTRIGFHIRPSTINASWNDIAGVIDRVRPSNILIMDDPDYALRLKTTFPQLTVTHREYRIGQLEWQGSAWQSVAPEEIADYFRRTPMRGIYRHSVNEPDTRNTAFIAWTIKLIEACGKLQIPVDVFQSGSGRYEPYEVEAGMYDALLRACDRYRETTRLATHQYQAMRWDVDVENGVPAMVLAKDPTLPESVLPVKENRYGHNWLRHTILNKRADAIGVSRPRMVISELGFDRLTNLTEALDLFQRSTGGIEPFEGQAVQQLFGAETYRRAWAKWYPSLSWGQAYAHQFHSIEPHWMDNVEGATVYMMDSSDWRGRGFNILDGDFLDALA